MTSIRIGSMTLFQALGAIILQSITIFIPVSSHSHGRFLEMLTGWEPLPPVLQATFLVAAALALFVLAIHDWLSFFSVGLQTLLLRKRPRTYDERLPIYLIITVVTAAAGQHFLAEFLERFEIQLIADSLILAAMALPLIFFDRWSKKNKRILDWNLFDAFLLGLFLILAPLPGVGFMTIGLILTLARHYQAEAAVRYLYYCFFPLLVISAWHWVKLAQEHGWPDDLSKLTVGVSFVISFVVSWLIAGSFLKALPSKGLGAYISYRLILGIGMSAYLGWKLLH